MVHYAQLFVNHMIEQGVKYTEQKENVIKVVYSGDNLDTIPIYVFFDKDGDSLISCKCWDILSFKNNKAAGIAVCNALNARFRWVKFYIDDDADVVADLDAVIDDETCGAECLQLVRRMVSIIDDAYPDIIKARF